MKRFLLAAAIVMAMAGPSSSQTVLFGGWGASVVANRDSVAINSEEWYYMSFTPYVSSYDSLYYKGQWSTSSSGPWNDWHSVRRFDFTRTPPIYCPSDEPFGFVMTSTCVDIGDLLFPAHVTFQDPDILAAGMWLYSFFKIPGKYYVRGVLLENDLATVHAISNIDSCTIVLGRSLEYSPSEEPKAPSVAAFPDTVQYFP